MAQEAAGQEVPLVEMIQLAKETRITIELSRVEAVNLESGNIATEHLLLALCGDDEIAGFLTHNFGITASHIEDAIKLIYSGKKELTPFSLNFTDPRVEKALNYADVQREIEQVPRITNFHLLIGLVREGEGVAFSMLESLGVNFEKLIEKYQNYLIAKSHQGITEFLQSKPVSLKEKTRITGQLHSLAEEAGKIREDAENPPARRPSIIPE